MIITIFTSLVTFHSVEILIEIACNESDSETYSKLKSVLERNRYFLSKKNHYIFLLNDTIKFIFVLWKSNALLISFPNCFRSHFLTQYVTAWILTIGNYPTSKSYTFECANDVDIKVSFNFMIRSVPIVVGTPTSNTACNESDSEIYSILITMKWLFI